TERFPDIDLALITLDTGVKYSNDSYFEAPVARRLVASEFKDGKPGGNDWFFVDTPYTGLLAMAWVGVRTQILPEDGERVFHGLRYNRKCIARAFGTNVGKLMD